MNKISLFLFTIFFCCAFLLADVPPLPNDGEAYVPGELVVYTTTNSQANPSQLLETWGYQKTRQQVVFGNMQLSLYKAQERSVAKNVLEAVALFNGDLARENKGAKLLPNYIFRVYDNKPNDPLFGRKDTYKDKDGNSHDVLLQWDMSNPGELKGVPNADLNVLEAWKLLPKSDTPIIVAVVDTGVDVEHPALKNRIYKKDGQVVGKDFTSLVGGSFMDDHGHGSHCAGSIAAVYNDGEGMTGSSGPTNVLIMPIKALAKNGAGNLISIALAMKWAGEQGADVLSMSFGATPIIPEQEPILLEVFNDILASPELENTIPVGAAGNNGKDIHAFPAFCDAAIAIGASDHQDKIASFSNFGNWVDVVSPGVNIVSVRAKFDGKFLDMYRDAGYDKAEFAVGNDMNAPYDTRGYYIASGTSMACPNAAGVVAMILAVKPELKANTEAIRTLLMETSDKKGTFNIKEDGGRINALKALQTILK